MHQKRFLQINAEKTNPRKSASFIRENQREKTSHQKSLPQINADSKPADQRRE